MAKLKEVAHDVSTNAKEGKVLRYLSDEAEKASKNVSFNLHPSLSARSDLQISFFSASNRFRGIQEALCRKWPSRICTCTYFFTFFSFLRYQFLFGAHLSGISLTFRPFFGSSC